MNWLIVMAGGYGERFWPMSRRQHPKQLLPIVGRLSMIQQTVGRLRPLFDWSRIVVVTNREQAALVRRQLPRLRHILAEPVGRNTAPCVALAAAYVGKRDPAAVMSVVPADAWVGDAARYRRIVRDAMRLAGAEPVLVTIGIRPTSPHTGYGYIQLGEKFEIRNTKPSPRDAEGRGRQYETEFWKAGRFVEKPDRATAERFLASGAYRWNAGMFVWSLSAVMAAFRRHQPDLLARCERIVQSRSLGKALAREYPRLEKISVDYAIMEKAGNVVVANGDFAWDDVGDWIALQRHLARDVGGNAARGAWVGLDAEGCVVSSADPSHLVAAVGVRDLVIVHTADATLVCKKSDTQKVRDLVRKLAAEKKYRKYL